MLSTALAGPYEVWKKKVCGDGEIVLPNLIILSEVWVRFKNVIYYLKNAIYKWKKLKMIL